MEDNISSVGCVTQVGIDAAGAALHHHHHHYRSKHRSHSANRFSRHSDEQERHPEDHHSRLDEHRNSQIYARSSSLDTESGRDVLSPGNDYLDRLEDEDDLENTMTPEPSSLLAHRRTASPADCTSHKKSNKPLMEKKRRQRINRCVNDLKMLVLEALKKDPSRYSKLEKADILEMTVKHLQMLHKQEAVAGRMMGGSRFVNGDDLSKYRAGFAHCAAEVTKFLASLNNIPSDLHSKVLSHLNSLVTSSASNVNANATCVQNNVSVMANPAPIILVLNNPATATTPVSQIATQPIGFQDSAGNSLGAQPNFTVIAAPRTQGVSSSLQLQPQTNNVQILPPRLNNGDLTLILPATVPLVTQNKEIRSPPSNSLQASAPVLTAILTSDRNHISSSNFVQPPALSTSSDDSALGPETLDVSDSEMSCSGVSTPISSMSAASSPLPAEEAGRISPKKGTSRSASSPKSQLWSSTSFREELDASASSSQSNARRHQIIAPKPSCPWSSRPNCSDANKRKKANTPPPPPEEDLQSMWRPWH
ncbi:hypothetical protein SK128_003554 [Halocaridina rubra]|uniref:Uncharacterized protein n=1 Tax=Halocaridina rubra TaxID=373956 RepID=A0AAN8ZZB2_HALRR